MDDFEIAQRHSAAIDAIAKKLNSLKTTTVKTPRASVSQSFILSRLVASKHFPQAPVLLVVEDEYQKFNLCTLMRQWNSPEETPIPVLSAVDPFLLHSLATKQPSFIVLSKENIKELVPSPALMREHTITLEARKTYTRETLLSQLVHAGYRPSKTAYEEGTFATRGSIVDVIAPHTRYTLRIDFFGDEVESITRLSAQKKNQQPSTHAQIIPYSLGHTRMRTSLERYLAPCARIVLEPFPANYDVALSFTHNELSQMESHIQPQRGSRKKQKDLSFIKKLKPGDAVVHADHGVGTFEGMVVQEIEGTEREYFKLTYAESDKLFVPVTLAEKIEKYVGDIHPPLNRLSGNGWNAALTKAKTDTLHEARDLLNTQARRKLISSPVIERDKKVEALLEKTFPYTLTDDQRETIENVYNDMTKENAMDRLVCGDVGFGKTEVAVRAATKAAMAGFQVALLSPTTILAQQHVDTFTDRIKEAPIVCASLSRFQSKKAQAEIVERLACGTVDIVIGTHRLLSNDVEFKNLGLIIIDEEQRFGVKHKEQLKKMRSGAHVLTLTATPIPRTLHLALSGVRDISVITTAPGGRKPIETHIEPYNHTKIREVLELELKRKGQVYYLYNNIETIRLKEKELKELLPKATIGILHGQLPEAEVAEVMHSFDKRKIDILVCSTIIENGLDLPNVNTLIVDNAVQFGLSQLHQIRGRIGRGSRQAYAYFFYKRQKLTGEAEKRLQALEEARELGAGFDLAMRDMEIRGVGNILGKRQHGHVKSIGLGLYMRLLSQAVEEIQSGKPVEALADISVDLPIEARIPPYFEPDKEKRIERYHEWAMITELDELIQTMDVLKKEGALPKALEHLFYIFRLKILGRKANIRAIDTIGTAHVPGEQSIVLMTDEPTSPERFAKMLDVAPQWQYSTEELSIRKSDLGSGWLEKLEKSVNVLASV